MENKLHIVAFNIPYPANYGGVIDIYYKLKALSEKGVKVILHAFEYGRERPEDLNRFCEKIYYYKRETGLKSQFSFLPYIVYSRRSKALIENLLKDNHPIFFEGLHTCYYLNDIRLKNRLKLVRLHNIEHIYYKGLAFNSKSLRDKIFMKIEAFRLKKFEKRLSAADFLLPLSTTEEQYFIHQFGKEKIHYIPLFHANKNIDISEIMQPYVLYHGDMSTPENKNAANYLIKEIAKKDKTISWVFAGLNPHQSIYKNASGMNNVVIKANLPHHELSDLIQHAAVNILFTNQISGVKLKLINALFQGHFCLANSQMTEGSQLESLCVLITDNRDQLPEVINKYLHKEFPRTEIVKRKKILEEYYNNEKNANKIIFLLNVKYHGSKD